MPRRSSREWKEAPWMYRLVHRVGYHLLRLALRLRFRGAENFPREGPVLLVSNHHSWADGFVAGIVCPRPMRFIGKAELFRRKSWAWFFRSAGVIPVDRQKEGQARTTYLPPGANAEAMREAIAALEAGRVVAIYPEGTLRKPHDRGRNKTGVAALALATGATVVPVGMVTHRVWPGYAWIPRFGRKSYAVVGKPLTFPRDPEGARDRERLQRVADDIMREVYARWEEAAAELGLQREHDETTETRSHGDAEVKP